MAPFSEKDAIIYHDIQLVLPSQVYSPAEDTDLCIQGLLEWAGKISIPPHILEIGSGPGTLSLILARFLIIKGLDPHIWGIDINPHAVEVAQFNNHLNHLENYCQFILGDLFAPLKQKQKLMIFPKFFDLIFFNPPYLASEDDVISQKNRQPIDAAWEGGSKGDEITIQFLESCVPFLKKKGDIFFVSSSLIDQSRILNYIDRLHFKTITTKHQHIFFEDILLYHLQGM
jgi:HemK-related putative methylase